MTEVSELAGKVFNKGFLLSVAPEMKESSNTICEASKLANGVYPLPLDKNPDTSTGNAKTTDREKILKFTQPVEVKTTYGKTAILEVEIEKSDNKNTINAGDTKCIDANHEVDFPGFCVNDPTPIRISVTCGKTLLAPPKILNSYAVARVVNPQRNFLTNRHETYNFSNGVITEVNYDAQSPIKGAFDTLLSPVKGVLSTLPTSSTQTTTSVQTGGGKPDQTTNTTQTSVAPPK